MFRDKKLLGKYVFVLCISLVLMACGKSQSQKENLMLDHVAVDENQLKRHVKTLSVDYLPRDYSNVENLNASALYIKRQFEEIGLEVIEQKYTVDGVEYKNIMTTLGPQSGPKVVVGAHYDVAGLMPGADDNASGVAGLIELARLLKNEKLNRGVQLVAYTLEEPPFFASQAMGSYIHAKSEREKGAEIDLMISLEMIGYFSDEEGSQSYPSGILNWFYPETGDFIAVIGQLFSGWAREMKNEMNEHMSVQAHYINAPSAVTGVDFSDHRNYWEFGYDAVMVTNTAFYRNTAYHTEDDTHDRLNYSKMAEVVKGVFGYVLELCK